MEIERVTIFMKLKKGGNMSCKKNIKVLKAGKKVVPALKRTANKAIKDIKKTYPSY